MKKLLALSIVSLLSADVIADQVLNASIECIGNSVIEKNTIIEASIPFYARFNIEGSTVTMIEGDTLHFSSSYEAHDGITSKGRAGYASDKGNLFLYRDSGRFEIISVGVSRSGVQLEKTSGECTKFNPDNVFI